MSKRVYQRTLPMFLVSAFMLIMIAQYFSVSVPALNALKGEATQWGVVASAVTMLYTQIIFIAMYARRLVERKDNRKTIIEAATFIGTFILFISIAGIERSLGEGPNYQLLYLAIVGVLSSGTSGLRFFSHAWVGYRVLASITTLESAVFSGVWVIMMLRQMTTMMVIAPQIGLLGDWIAYVPMIAVQRVTIGTLGISSLIMGLRGLIGKEPGIIEAEPTEVVQKQEAKS